VVERFAVISDVHANAWALEAVLEAIGQRNIKTILNLGDCVYGLLEPARSAELLMKYATVSISGNQDREVLDSSMVSATYEFVREQLTREHKTWLASLPMTTMYQEAFLCHGTPHSDETYLLESPNQAGLALHSSETIENLLGDIKANLIFCGHSHTSRTVLVSGRLIVNPGSVGLQAYQDEEPFVHSMQMGSPHARFAICEKRDDGWFVEHVVVPYDWEKAASTAANYGHRDWEHWLRYGRA
jgi:putative phosphoesterase